MFFGCFVVFSLMSLPLWSGDMADYLVAPLVEAISTSAVAWIRASGSLSNPGEKPWYSGDPSSRRAKVPNSSTWLISWFRRLG